MRHHVYYGVVHGELGHEHVRNLKYPVREQTIPMSCDRLLNEWKGSDCQHLSSLQIFRMVLETELKGTKISMKPCRLYLENSLEPIGKEVTLH